MIKILYGTKRYYLRGMLHRIDGPAIECDNGPSFYFLNGVFLPKNIFITNVNNPNIWYLNGKFQNISKHI